MYYESAANLLEILALSSLSLIPIPKGLEIRPKPRSVTPVVLQAPEPECFTRCDYCLTSEGRIRCASCGAPKGY